MRRFLAAIASLLLLAGASPTKAATGDEAFPRPYALQPQIRFWKRVYTEVDTNGGLIHDAEHLDVVYETVRMPEGLSGGAFQARVDARKEAYRRMLLSLAEGRRDDLSPDEQRVLQLWPSGVASETLRHAAENVRFQLGQADRFREGLVRSGRWESQIRRTLELNGVPPELAALPHVESSYNPEAYSRVGAAGIWQFMRKTARRFMRVDDVVDERFDPLRSSQAAAHFLAENYRETGSWPLAVTAYNHGAGGVKRAEQILGTEDIATIVRRYKSPTFGFASRNFYTSFLAALDVSSDPERYFGAMERSAPLEFRTYVLPHSYSVGALQHAVGVNLDTLRADNLALRTPFWRGRRYAPAGYALRLPSGHAQGAELALANAPPEPHSEVEVHTRTYRVARGDTLRRIAHRFGVSERTLLAQNQINPHRLRPGTLLTISSVRRVAVAEPVRAELPVARMEPVPADAEPSLIPPPAQEVAPSPSPGDEPVASATAPGTETVSEAPLASTAAPEPASSPTREPVPPAAAPAQDSAGAAEPPAAAPVAQEALPSPSPAEETPQSGAAPAVNDSPAPPSLASSPSEQPAPPSSHPRKAVASAPAESVPAASPTANLDLSAGRYRVDAKGFIEVQADETLGHYAQWLNVSAARLRSLNGLRAGHSVAIGRRLRLDFSRCSHASFEERRLAYHEALRREFFDTFEVAGTEQYVLRKGDTLWSLSRGQVAIPVWLLHQYNPDLDLASLRPGVRVTIPRVQKRGTTESGEARQSEGA